MTRLFWCCIILLLLANKSQAQQGAWVDSVLNTLSEDEKIAQLFLTRISSLIPEEVADVMEKKVQSGGLGGVLFTNGSLRRQAMLANKLQRSSQVPLLVIQDASAGVGQLVDSAMKFPDPMIQAAIRDDSTVYRIAKETARQLKVMGIHMNLGPQLGEPENVGSFNHFFGETPAIAARTAGLHIRGLKQGNVLSCAKFFPLVADTVLDDKGNVALRLTMDSLRAAPFLNLSQSPDAILTEAGSLEIFFEQKKQDLRKKLSSETLSHLQSGNLLRRITGHKGLIIVDASGIGSMESLEDGDRELLAFQSGADLIISDDNIAAAQKKIRRLVNSDESFGVILDDRVRRILQKKYAVGLSKYNPIDLYRLERDMFTPDAKVLHRNSYAESITAIRNRADLLPIKTLEDRNFIAITTGDSSSHAKSFIRTLRKYVPVSHLAIGEKPIAHDLSGHNVVIVALFPSTSGKTLQNVMGLLQEITPDQQVVIADFGCAAFRVYATSFNAVITAYQVNDQTVSLVPQVIFGGIGANGILPFEFGDIDAGTSDSISSVQRLAYSIPEDVEMDDSTLDKIEQIAREAIDSGSTPGCYVIIARKGKVIYDRAFGHLTYDRKVEVSGETLYDLASLTKVAATLQAMMFMTERNLIDIHKKLSVYLPELKGSNKKDITIIDALTHQAGLTPFIPLWPQTLDGPQFRPVYYSSRRDVSYPLQISSNLFGSNILRDSVYSWITFSKMLDKPQRFPYPYRYSDLGFMMFKQLAERTLNQPIEDFLQQNFYEPLGAYSIGYTPLARFPESVIAPTERDTLFRRGLLIGTVHDERAAMLGGVSGHAGLFGTATDLAKIGQMLLQEGTYGGHQFYKPETVKLFTSKQYNSSRRGLGWDKPVQSEWNSPTGRLASPKTFGHTGFTGTCMWVDPEFDLVFIFLSNRVFPDRSDKLIQTNIRSRIQDVAYQSIFNYCRYNDMSN